MFQSNFVCMRVCDVNENLLTAIIILVDRFQPPDVVVRVRHDMHVQQPRLRRRAALEFERPTERCELAASLNIITYARRKLAAAPATGRSLARDRCGFRAPPDWRLQLTVISNSIRMAVLMHSKARYPSQKSCVHRAPNTSSLRTSLKCKWTGCWEAGQT